MITTCTAHPGSWSTMSAMASLRQPASRWWLNTTVSLFLIARRHRVAHEPSTSLRRTPQKRWSRRSLDRRPEHISVGSAPAVDGAAAAVGQRAGVTSQTFVDEVATALGQVDVDERSLLGHDARVAATNDRTVNSTCPAAVRTW